MPALLVKKFNCCGNSNPSILRPLFRLATQVERKEDDAAPFMAQYLISSFNFPEDRARKVATDKSLSPIKSSERPESVVRFLKDTGMDDAQIKDVISWCPQVLSYSVSKTLEPWARGVINAGFKRETLVQLIRSNPKACAFKEPISKLKFWSDFVGNNDEALLRLVKRNQLLQLHVDERVVRGIDLLRGYGLSDKQIQAVLRRTNHLLKRSPESMKFLFEQIERLGLPRGSKSFLNALAAFGYIDMDSFNARLAFYKTAFGLSQEDINLAFKKYPQLVNLTEGNVSYTMDFLVKKVGLNPRSVLLLWPWLLSVSLEKRLIPRHYVLTVLKSKGLDITWSFFSVCVLSEKLFLAKFILPYKDEVPNIAEEYDAARAGKMTL